MQLPNASLAVIDDEKLVHYLLDLQHQRGGSKAAARRGFCTHWGIAENIGNSWQKISAVSILPLTWLNRS